MKFTDYLKDQVMTVILNLSGMLIMGWFLFAVGNSLAVVWLTEIAWVFIFLCVFFTKFLKRRRFFDKNLRILDNLEERYLFAEVMQRGETLEDRLYYKMLQKSNKSVIEKINMLEEEQKEYREYIEGWIHEVKTPLTAMHLMCNNNPGEVTEKIDFELGRLEKQVEQALFYARSEEAYKDYLIRPTDLKQVVLDTVKRNKRYFISNHMSVIVDMEKNVVSTDEKWIGFLLDQVFSNAIKYHRDLQPIVKITAERKASKVILSVWDNGIGVPVTEIGRIFQKGYTGTNGRKIRESTGIGLYLCKKLCDKLGIGIGCESEEGSYTKILFVFPDSDYMKITKM